MSEPKLISPLLDGMELATNQPMGEHDTVCALRHTTTNQFYMLKQLDLPQSATQVEALLVTGAVADEESAQKYYEQLVDEHIQEFKLWYSLNGSTNLAAFLDYQVEPKEDEVGFHLYLLSHHWHTLSQFLWDNPITWLKALNLGVDLCSALCQLRAAEVVHRNIKPSNIYMDSLGNFMLGDLGLEAISNLRFATMDEHMISEYSAPEACDVIGELNPTMDIYSVGMVLYRILNSNHGPFEDEATSAKAANLKRISGEPLPAPLYADYELSEIVLKACAYHPVERYQTPEEFQQDLVLYMQRNRVSDQLIVPPIVTDADILLAPEQTDEVVEPVRFATDDTLNQKFVDSFSPETQNLEPVVKAVQKAAPKDAPIPPNTRNRPRSPAPPKKRKKPKVGMWIAVFTSLVALGVIGLLAYFFLYGGTYVNVASLTVTDKYVDYLTIVAQLEGEEIPIEVVCSDDYGNVIRTPYVSGGTTLSNLEPGTQYTITLYSTTDANLTGTTYLKATTNGTTDVVSFIASAPAVGQAQLDFVVSGTDSETWSITYSAEYEEAQTVDFTGHSVLIFGLTPGLTYTFTLEPPAGGAISGVSTATLRVGPEVSVENLTTSELTISSATLVWEASEPLPEGESWVITATTNDGTPISTVTATETTAYIDGMEAGNTYIISVSSPSTVVPGTLVVSPTVAEITNFTAAVGEEAASVDLAWECDIVDGDWRILYTPKFTNLTEIAQVSGNSATLTNLIPGTTYEFELQTGAGQKVSGTGTAEVVLSTTGTFSSYGIQTLFTNLFVHPGTETWVRGDLSTTSTEFAPEEPFAFAAQDHLATRTDSDDIVDVTIVVRDSMDIPVYYEAYSDGWDTLWNNDDLFMGEVTAAPSEPGTYTFELYFNHKRIVSKEFTVQ